MSPEPGEGLPTVRLSRILAPVDFSPRSRGSAHYAQALACHFRAQVVLLHAVAPVVPPYGPTEPMAYTTANDIELDILAQRRAMLEDFLPGEWRNLAVERVVLTDDPAHAIVEHAADTGCDLIVMPTHGHGRFRRFLLGSVTAKVLHDAACPIWTGPHLETAPAAESIQFRKVMCAVDLGPESQAVARWAAGFASEFAAELAMVHVLPISTARLGGIYFSPEWHAEVAAHARAGILSLTEELGTPTETMVETGDVADTIGDLALEWKADLLVIGRGHRPGVLGRLRANAFAILRESPCPVAAI